MALRRGDNAALMQAPERFHIGGDGNGRRSCRRGGSRVYVRGGGGKEAAAAWLGILANRLTFFEAGL